VALNEGGAPAFRLVTLGVVRLLDDAGRDVAPGQRKLLALLAYLAQRSPRPAAREELATLVWGERPEENARGSLRQALFQLKRLVGDALDVTPDAAAVRGGAIDVDASSFEADVVAGRVREAAMRWGGDYLTGLDDAGAAPLREWLEAERARLGRMLTRALDELISDAAARGAWAEAAGWADRWATAAPLDERAARHLVESLSLAGRGAEALARHAAFVARHGTELGAAPSEDFLRLASRVERRARTPYRRTGVARGAAVLAPPELTGRDDAFAELTGAWRDARRRQSVVVVIEGEAGAGKTRLAEEFVHMVETGRAPAVLLRAAAHPADRDVPFAIARALFSSLCDAPGLLGASPRALAEVAALVPALAETVRELPPPSGTAGALGDALAEVIAGVADEAPVLLFVDDLAHADAESRRLVLSLSHRAGEVPLMLLACVRPGDLAASDEWRDLRAARLVRLKPLDVPGAESVIASMLPVAEDERRALAERIVAETGGFPLDVTEMLAALLDAGQLEEDAAGQWRTTVPARSARMPVPDAVRRAVRARLSHLSPRAGALLDAAAVLACPVDPTTLGDVLDLDAAIVGDAIGELVARGILRVAGGPQAGAEPQYEIAYDLARRTALERLSDDRRAALQAASARARPASATSSPSSRSARAIDALDERYAIERVLAEGRLVTAYAARDLRDSAEVELYVVRGAPLAVGQHFLHSFERVAALSDPHLRPVLDFGATPDALFYVTAPARGVTLRERLVRDRSLAIDEAIRIGTDVARALAAAHAGAIVHGDLRPKHVTVTSSGASLAGLGLVEALGAQGGSRGPEGTGITIGAPAYMSPEQLTGEVAVDARSDVYSLGVVLYEMLAGELPFTGAHQSLITRKLTQPAPSVRERRDSVPKAIDWLVRRCLARVPADRYPSATELLTTLEEAAGD
jgi:serine/threonine-protein kinase